MKDNQPTPVPTQDEVVRAVEIIEAQGILANSDRIEAQLGNPHPIHVFDHVCDAMGAGRLRRVGVYYTTEPEDRFTWWETSEPDSMPEHRRTEDYTALIGEHKLKVSREVERRGDDRWRMHAHDLGIGVYYLQSCELADAKQEAIQWTIRLLRGRIRNLLALQEPRWVMSEDRPAKAKP